MFILPFAISIMFKTLQVLIVSVPLSVLLFIFILFFIGRPHNELMGSMQHSQINWQLKSQKHTGRTPHYIGMYT
jgi:uncharacterized membrane protein (DUF106 family)